MRTFLLTVSWILVVLVSCKQREKPLATPPMEVISDSSGYQLNIPAEDTLYDKVLGSLTGSAIGDAMGAPTEMWSRDDRMRSYGYIDSLDPSFIDPSPEGLWDFHLPTGATTDDTRWKSLVGNFVVQQMGSFYQKEGPDPFTFAGHILSAYQQEVERLKQTPGDDPAEIEYNFRRLSWLQEWASVAKPFADNDLESYTTALHRFYGGDLLCAGILYAPVVGVPYPGDPWSAYKSSHRLSIFDQGYARDITGLTSAMVAAAMASDATPASIMEVFRTVDPYNYFRSRIFGREAFKTFRAAEYIAQSAKDLERCENSKNLAQSLDIDSLEQCRLQLAYELLDESNQHSPAHAQEILLVTLTALLYSDFDFQKCMEFIVNYGRDNDTSGAMAGAILGAYLGYNKLPETIKKQVINTNRNNLGIDLEVLAAGITDGMLSLGTRE